VAFFGVKLKDFGYNVEPLSLPLYTPLQMVLAVLLIAVISIKKVSEAHNHL
jgi:hypothetical protein